MEISRQKIQNKFWQLIVSTKSILNGHFYFSRQYHTQYYINTPIIFQYPRNVEMVVKELSTYFSDEKLDFIITPNYLGGALIAHYMGEKYNAKVITLRRENGYVIVPPDLELEGNLLIVDEFVHTGNSLKQVLDVTVRSNINLVGIGIFIDRYVGDLKNDFANIKSVISLKESAYELVNIDRKECEKCNEYSKLLKDIKMESSQSRIRHLLEMKKELELKSGYRYLN